MNKKLYRNYMEISTKVQKQGRDVPRPLSLCMGFMNIEKIITEPYHKLSSNKLNSQTWI